MGHCVTEIKRRSWWEEPGLPFVFLMSKQNLFGSVTRRECLKTLVVGVAQLGMAAGAANRLFMAEVMAQEPSTDGVLNLDLGDFTTLQQDFGSILLRVPGLTGFPQLVITRMPNNVFHAVTSRCTHQGCTVSAYRPALNAITCSCHGSRFTVDGEVLNGPASAPLTQYPTQFTPGGPLSILIPGLAYRLNIATVAAGPGMASRLRIEFPTVRSLRYSLNHRSSLNSGNWTPVAFALTPDGPLDQTQLVGDGNPAVVYVNKVEGSGFYVVSRS